MITFPKATWSARKAVALVSLATKARPKEVERELAEMTGSLEQLAELEEKEEEEESGSSVHGSETCLREY